MFFDVSDEATRDVVINQGLAAALIDLLESSLASSKSRPKAEAIVKIFESHLLKYADISIYVAQQIDRCSDDLCSLYNTLDGNNARHAKTLLLVFYRLSVQKSNRSLLEKPAVFSFIWKSLNVSDSDDNIQCVAAELFASLTFESSKPFFGATTNYHDGLSAEMFWQRISANCEKVPPPTTYDWYFSTHHFFYYLTGGRRNSSLRNKYTIEMIVSCLENDCSILQLVYTLSTLTSFLLAKDMYIKSEIARIAKRLCSLEKDPRITNGYTKNLIENIPSYIRDWKV